LKGLSFETEGKDPSILPGEVKTLEKKEWPSKKRITQRVNTRKQYYCNPGRINEEIVAE